MIVQLKSRHGMVALALVVLAVGAGVGVMAAGNHLASLRGIRLAAFIVGTMGFAFAIYLFQRSVRRRARLEAIADLLPAYRHHRFDDEFLLDQADLEDRLSESIPGARADVRHVTRALLVSLEEEMRRETGRVRRSSRPACRHARLRVAGQTPSRRRRVPLRLATSPS